MQHMVSDVAEFHKAFGAFTSPTPCFPSDERIALRRSLVAEEHSEFWRGVSAWDMVEAADGITDLLYVLVGTGLEFGIPMAINRCGRKPRAPRFPDEDTLAVRRREISGAMMSFWQVVTMRDIDGVALALPALINRCIATAVVDFGIPLKLCWAEVHRANMSKLNYPHRDRCTIGPNVPCSCGAVEYRRDGKVLKGKGYRAPNIQAILEAHGWRRPEVVAPYNP